MSELFTIEYFRRFLRCDFEQPMDEQMAETGLGQGVPAPAAHKPVPAEAALFDLAPPEELKLGRMPVAQAIVQRRSRRQYADDPLTLDELSFLLWATQGVKRSLKRGFEQRTVPAAGAHHPFETYLSVHRVSGLEAGLYRYLALEHRLCLLYLDAHLAEKICQARGGERHVLRCAVYFIWTAVPCRKEWIYGFWADKDTAIEAGHVCQNLYLASEAIGCGACATTVHGTIGPSYDQLLGVDGREEFSVYAANVGKLKTSRQVEWSGQITRVDAVEDRSRLWVRSYSYWDGDMYVVEFPSARVSGYSEGEYVGITGKIVDMCSGYEGWPLVRGIAIERRSDPDAGVEPMT